MVKNQGDIPGDAGFLDWWADRSSAPSDDSGSTGYVRAGTLEADEITIYTAQFKAPGTTGSKTFWALIDSTKRTLETNEDNNTKSASYKVQVLPDFVVSSISLSPTTVAPGGQVTATVTVTNQGGGSGDAGYLDVWYDKPEPASVGDDGDKWEEAGIIHSGYSKDYTYTFTASGLGTKTFRAFIDSYNNTSEVYESNNQGTKTYTVESKTLTINPTSRHHTRAAASNQKIDVTANVQWTATENLSWVTITSGGSGNGNETIYYSVSENTSAPRSGTITVSGGGITRTFTVTQSGDTEARRVTVTPVSAGVDADIDIPILIDNANGVLGFAVTLNYPANLADYVSVSPGSLTAGWSIVPNGGTDGRVVISSAGATALSGSGSLCVVRLHTAASAGNGTISVNSVQLNDGGIPSQGISGVSFATTARFLWGDVNGDAVVGTLDASGILKAVAGLPSVIVTRAPPNPPAGDVDGNGTIGTLDASYILKKVAGIIAPTGFPADTNHDSYGPEAAPNATPNMNPVSAALAVVPLGGAAARQLSIAPVSPPPDADIDIPIMIDDASDVEGFAVTLNYPAALADYVSVSPGSLLTEDWSIIPNGSEDGKVVIAAAGATALSGSGSLCVVRLHTVATAGSGTMSLAPVNLNDGATPAEGATGIAWGTPSQSVLSVTPGSRSVSKDAGTTTFSVANAGSGSMNWTAAVTSGGTWARITSGASGINAGTITVGFDANPAGGVQRTATIRVTAPGATGSPVDVTVVQAAPLPALSVTPGSHSVSKDAGTTTFSVANAGSGSMNWTAAVTSGGTWARITSGTNGNNAGTITVGFDANPADGAQRTATIRVTALGATGSPTDVRVVQEANFTAPTITTSSPLPDGTVGSAYSVTLAASGGKTPYTWSRVSGSLPAGLALSSGGVISGKPTASGPFNFTIRVTGGNNLSSTKVFSLTINAGEEGVLFSEDWESGQIDTSKWKIWGYPAPTIVSGGNSIGNYALTSNGDASYESGVTSLQSFEVRPRLTVSAKVFVQAPGTDVWSKRSWHGLALSSRPPAEWGDSNGAGDSLIGPFINLRGNTPTDTGLAVTTPSGGKEYASAPYLDKWTTIAFTFNADGSVTYCVNDQVLHTTSAGWINYANVPVAYLVCGGRSEGSSVVNLHDDIICSLNGDVGNDFPCAPTGDVALTTTGSYDGFFYADRAFWDDEVPTVLGTLNVKLSNLDGKLTAKAVLRAGSASFSGKLWTRREGDGTRFTTLTTRGGERLDLFVRQNRIWGTLKGGKAGAAPLALEGARNRFADKKDMAAQAILNQYKGYYTARFESGEFIQGALNAAPQGYGYLTLTVNNGGKVRIAGILADGTKVSQSSQLLHFADCGEWLCVPLFVPLYRKTGYVGGLFWIYPDTREIYCGVDTGESVRWEKPGKGPDGFTGLLGMVGGPYNNKSPVLQTRYVFESAFDWDLAAYHAAGEAWGCEFWPMDVPVDVTGSRMKIVRGDRPVRVREDGETWYEYGRENPNMVTLSFTARTGIFRGNFTLYYDYHDERGRFQHKTVKVPYAGVMLQNPETGRLNSGYGHCLFPSNDPELKAYKIKPSFPVGLWSD